MHERAHGSAPRGDVGQGGDVAGTATTVEPDSEAVIDLRFGSPVIDLGERSAGRDGGLAVADRVDLRTPAEPDRSDPVDRLGRSMPVDLERRAEELAPILGRFGSDTRARPSRLRRLVDLAVVAAIAPIALPLIALGALALKIEDPSGPVLYRQDRTGYRCRRFQILKLRSMVPNADELKATLAEQNLRDGPDFKVVDDPRITAVGRQLRRTSIDELPQLWNVFRGDMTLVGPRPTSLDIDAYQDWQKERFDTMPGLTGLWQVAARDSESWDDRIALDIAYVRRARPLLDLWILLKTIQVVIVGVGST